jgi:hypothetical protein
MKTAATDSEKMPLRIASKSHKNCHARWHGWSTAQVGRGRREGGPGRTSGQTDRQDGHKQTDKTDASRQDGPGRTPPSRRTRLPGRVRLGEGGRRWAPGRARTCETQASHSAQERAGGGSVAGRAPGAPAWTRWRCSPPRWLVSRSGRQLPRRGSAWRGAPSSDAAAVTPGRAVAAACTVVGLGAMTSGCGDRAGQE